MWPKTAEGFFFGIGFVFAWIIGQGLASIVAGLLSHGHVN